MQHCANKIQPLSINNSYTINYSNINWVYRITFFKFINNPIIKPKI
jgi:hypothetical protein